jgi:hypothetical protein
MKLGVQLSDILVAHEALRQVFELHQELLLALKLEPASEVLAIYEALLRVHMGHEEKWLLPELARVERPRWPATLYTGQHQKMIALLAEASESLSSIDREAPGASARALRGALIALLDRESTYKHLVEHHDSAEHQALYPELEAALPEDTKTALADRCLDEWNDAFEAARSRLMRLRALHLD